MAAKDMFVFSFDEFEKKAILFSLARFRSFSSYANDMEDVVECDLLIEHIARKTRKSKRYYTIKITGRQKNQLLYSLKNWKSQVISDNKNPEKIDRLCQLLENARRKS